MKILLTGGAGFIGSHLARRLLESGHSVLIIDNLITGRMANVPPAADFINLDLSRADFIHRLPNERFDAVCHLAAQSSGEISGENPLYDVQTNALSTLLLSRWCLRNKTPRFLYASSMAAYGNPERLPVQESTPCLPLSCYGVSKLTSEHFLRLAEREGLHSTSFRMFSVYGPGQNMENLKQGMASIFMAYMLKGVVIPVKGSLLRFRDFVYIDDVLDAWMKSLALPQTSSAVYNIGSGRQTTVRELIQALCHALDLPPTYPIQELPGSEADQFGLFADVSRAENELQWEHRWDLEKGLRVMADWAKAAVGSEAPR